MLRLDINLLFTVINLLIIFVIIRVFLFKPIHNILAKRQEEIDKQYADAKDTQDKANALKADYEKSFSNVEEEKRQAMDDARVKAKEEYDRIVAAANEEAKKVVSTAKATAKAEQEKSVKEASEQIEDLVLAATAKLVASGQGEQADRAIYNQFLAKTGEESE